MLEHLYKYSHNIQAVKTYKPNSSKLSDNGTGMLMATQIVVFAVLHILQKMSKLTIFGDRCNISLYNFTRVDSWALNSH